MKKTLTLTLALIIALVLFAGCSDENGNTSALTVTDMTGREVTLSGPAERIVALMPADCEIIYALGAGETLIGRGEYCTYPEEISKVPSVQSGYETNIEQIIALAPDVIIMSKMGQTVEQVAALENAGIEVFVSDAQDIAGVYTSIELLGKLTGKNEKASELISGMKADLAEIKATAEAKKKEEQTIYFESSPLEYGLWTAGQGTFIQEIAELLGVKNIFEDTNGWVEVSAEQVIARDPDFIITTTMYYGTGLLPVDEIKGRQGWSDISAIKNDKVFNAISDDLTVPSIRLVNGAQALCDFIYGK